MGIEGRNARNRARRGAASGLAAALVRALPAGAALALASGLALAGAERVREPSAGAALRAGLSALAAGRTMAAARRFENVAQVHPLVADHAERLRVAAYLWGGRPAEAVVRAQGFAERFPDSPVRGAVAQGLGEALVALGDEAGARDAFRSAFAAARDDETRAGLRLAVARSFEREGRATEAYREYLALWSELPTTPAGREATLALGRLREQGEPPLHLRIQRASALFEARANEEALAETELALGAGPPAARVRDLERQRAFLLFRLRRYPEAVQAFGALGKNEEALFWRARALARAGQIDASIAAFERLGRRPSATGARALFLAGTLLEGEGEAERARRHWSRVAKRAPAAELRREARWRLGWAAYREARYADAARQLDRLVELEPDPVERLQARYWGARARERAGAQNGSGSLAARARETFAALAAEFPLTYYGWRASERAGVAVGHDAPDAGRSRPGPADPARTAELPSRGTERIQILLEAGLREEATVETEALLRSSTGLEARLALAELFTQAGAFQRAQSLVLNGDLERLARGPGPIAPQLWGYAWPRAFAPAVEAGVQAAHAAVPEELVFAVMREESGYRPDAVSVVGARGLTQIMPRTGERLAWERGLDGFDPDQLFDPELNLELGAFYLARLLQRFGGRLSAAVAAYNAGPEAVERWIRERGALEDDEWVEEIPYDQTRQYARRVLRSVHAYRELYDRAAGSAP